MVLYDLAALIPREGRVGVMPPRRGLIGKLFGRINKLEWATGKEKYTEYFYLRCAGMIDRLRGSM